MFGTLKINYHEVTVNMWGNLFYNYVCFTVNIIIYQSSPAPVPCLEVIEGKVLGLTGFKHSLYIGYKNKSQMVTSVSEPLGIFL
jgi:hypothetical protein